MTLIQEFAKELGVTKQRAYQLLQPDKNRARGILNKTIERGLLNRPSNCENCTKECIVQGHHKDYTKPLEVLWLCKSCHIQKHHLSGRKGNLSSEEIKQAIEKYYAKKLTSFTFRLVKA